MSDHIVLIVDDTNMIRASTRYCLEKAGFEVEEAENGAVGLERLADMIQSGRRPDIILSDIHMPVMNGIEFITQAKKGDARFIPILVLTTETSDNMKQKGKAAGASGWLIKPFNEEELLMVVRKFIPDTTRTERQPGDGAVL